MKKVNAKDIRKVIELKERMTPERQIVAMGIASKGTISRLWNTARELGVTSQMLCLITDEEVMNVFYPKAGQRAPSKPMPDFQKIHTNMSTYYGRTLFHEWWKYRKEHPDGYSYGWCTVLYARWCNVHRLKPVLLMNEPAGERMYTDWAGRRLKFSFYDSEKPVEVHFFVTTLGASQMPYVEPTMDEELRTYLQCNINALRYYGGVPKYVVPDNLKTAVTQHKDREVVLQTVFEDMQDYYGYVVLAAHQASPTEKNDVENEVGISYDWVLSELEEHADEYHCMDDVRKATKKLLEEMCEQEFRDTGLNRREWFLSDDFPKLKPLPERDFQIYDYQYTEVGANYHVHIAKDNHKYSVPYQYIGQKVMLKYSFTTLKVFDMNRNLIAEWSRHYGNKLDNVHTKDEHRPPNHKIAAAMKALDPEWLLSKAREIGPATEAYIRQYMQNRKSFEQAYDGCMGIITMTWNSHKNKVSRQTMEQICREGLELGCISYGFIKNRANEIRKQMMDGRKEGMISNPANVRGRNNYK